MDKALAAFAKLIYYWENLLARFAVSVKMNTSTVWQISGISTSVWLRSICPDLHPIMSLEPAVVWDSVIPVRICWDLYI